MYAEIMQKLKKEFGIEVTNFENSFLESWKITPELLYAIRPGLYPLLLVEYVLKS